MSVDKTVEKILQENPLATFKNWFEEVQKQGVMKEPRAMALATLSPQGELHNRIVLLKQITDDGDLIFFTNYSSSKGKDLLENPRAEALFYWDHWQRQVRISGSVKRTERKVSEEYWNSRPPESQYSQYISKQSQPVKDRATLEQEVEKARRQFGNGSVPCPEHWGGYVLHPERVELWIAGFGRLHDRFEFLRQSKGWTSHRLYP